MKKRYNVIVENVKDNEYFKYHVKTIDVTTGIIVSTSLCVNEHDLIERIAREVNDDGFNKLVNLLELQEYTCNGITYLK